MLGNQSTFGARSTSHGADREAKKRTLFLCWTWATTWMNSPSAAAAMPCSLEFLLGKNHPSCLAWCLLWNPLQFWDIQLRFAKRLYVQQYLELCTLQLCNPWQYALLNCVRKFLRYRKVASRSTCYYSENQVLGGATNRDMSLNKTCFYS